LYVVNHSCSVLWLAVYMKFPTLSWVISQISDHLQCTVCVFYQGLLSPLALAHCIVCLFISSAYSLLCTYPQWDGQVGLTWEACYRY